MTRYSVVQYLPLQPSSSHCCYYYFPKQPATSVTKINERILTATSGKYFALLLARLLDLLE
jgi:hypothetical protein